MCSTDTVEKPEYGNRSNRVVDSQSIMIDNGRMMIRINKRNASVEAIHDRDHDMLYEMSGIGFVVHTDRGEMASGESAALHWLENGVRIVFAFAGFEIDVYYTLGAEQKFFEKWIEIKPIGDFDFFIHRVKLEDIQFKSEVKEIHFHDDQTIWHCPINLFIRSEKGGCFAGLEYPYWEKEIQGTEGFTLAYEPNCPVRQGEINTSEKYFLGVYHNEGIHRYSHGPYPGKAKAEYTTWEGTGLFQHFKDGKIPEAALEPEILDWGEVWAMQDFMRHVLPEQPLPEDGYWIWQNGWWAGLFKIEKGQLDMLKEAGIYDVMTAQTWYGHDYHPNTEPVYLDNMRMEPIGFPLPAEQTRSEDSSVPKETGWHVKNDVLGNEYIGSTAFEDEFRAPAKFEEYIEYGRSIGVHVNSYSLPNLYFHKRPEWGLIDSEGKPGMYIFGGKVSCPACDEYMDFLQKLYKSVFDKYQPRWWGWDGRWLSYWEVALAPNPSGARPDPCYAATHGHLPGDNRYWEWKNIMKLLMNIRERYPRMCLEQYLGLKRGGPWALRYFNCDDNYYESNGADSNRLQTWHNQNDRFRPPYLNYSAVFGETPQEFQFSVITTISTTRYCQIGPGFKGLALPENRDFLRKWRSWATDNLKYLTVKRDLFDCPGYTPVDGSAHIIKDRGFIFLFPGSLVSGKSHEEVEAGDSQKSLVKVSIRLNRWLCLEEDPDAVYTITEIYPEENRVVGICRYDDDFYYTMPEKTAVVLSLEPSLAGKQPGHIEPIADEGNDVVIKAFGSRI